MSNTLTEIYQNISAHDAAYIEKHAEQQEHEAELVKIAEEEDAAGRITARGFADELHKLAGGASEQPELTTNKTTKMKLAPSVKTKGYQIGTGATGPGPSKVQGRTIKAPPVPALKGRGSFTPGSTVGAGGQIKQPKPPGQ